MTAADILCHVDHTLLKSTASWAEVQKLCDEAIRFRTASVCIPPSYVKPVYDMYGTKVPVCTVIGFPLGYSTLSIKAAESAQALADGAAELDMVIDAGAVKNGDFDRIYREISVIKRLASGRIVKVIIETCNLNIGEKAKLCQLVTSAGADYIKTSTGFGFAGADIEDITLFKKYLGAGVKIKAAGGIKTQEAMEAFLLAGCDRLGSSSAVTLLRKGE
jgi:deoxyribose-phosphate aldolase